jgi:hypothetical protein
VRYFPFATLLITFLFLHSATERENKKEKRKIKRNITCINKYASHQYSNNTSICPEQITAVFVFLFTKEEKRLVSVALYYLSIITYPLSFLKMLEC